MRIGILGATSQIAKDLIHLFAKNNEHELVLFARQPEVLSAWKTQIGIQQDWSISSYEDFTAGQHLEVIMNFVGVGNPAQAAVMGREIFDITLQYDELALAYIKQNPTCRYIFLSSGAAYGSTFDEPANEKTTAHIPINNLKPQDWYGVAKLYAECRHRSLAFLSIVDIRVFNYFSATQNMDATFIITDIFRAIRDGVILKTSPDYIVRDFIHPTDFYSLVNSILCAQPINVVVDAYSKAPIDKPTLLATMHEKFGLQYEVERCDVTVNATGIKPHYYSVNHKAANFGYAPFFTSIDGLLTSFASAALSLKKVNNSYQ